MPFVTSARLPSCSLDWRVDADHCMMMMPPIVISLSFKLIFFVLVDGWRLVAGSLVASYGVGITSQ